MNFRKSNKNWLERRDGAYWVKQGEQILYFHYEILIIDSDLLRG